MNFIYITGNFENVVHDLFTFSTYNTEQKSNSRCLRASRRANIHSSFHGRRGTSRGHEKERVQCYPTLPEPKNWDPAKLAYGYVLPLLRQWAHFLCFAIVRGARSSYDSTWSRPRVEILSWSAATAPHHPLAVDLTLFISSGDRRDVVYSDTTNAGFPTSWTL